jgi:hypothetical protein
MSRRTDERDRTLLVRAARFDVFTIRDVGDGPDYFPAARLLRSLLVAGDLRRVHYGRTLPIVYEWAEP